VAWEATGRLEDQTRSRGTEPRHASREDYEKFLMGIETVIGRFREGRFDSRRVALPIFGLPRTLPD
jgi:hypothetical protein